MTHKKHRRRFNRVAFVAPEPDEEPKTGSDRKARRRKKTDVDRNDDDRRDPSPSQ